MVQEGHPHLDRDGSPQWPCRGPRKGSSGHSNENPPLPYINSREEEKGGGWKITVTRGGGEGGGGNPLHSTEILCVSPLFLFPPPAGTLTQTRCPPPLGCGTVCPSGSVCVVWVSLGVFAALGCEMDGPGPLGKASCLPPQQGFTLSHALLFHNDHSALLTHPSTHPPSPHITQGPCPSGSPWLLEDV